MNKYIFSVLFSLLISGWALAQNEIPNPGFEMWSGDEPDFWATFNSYGTSPNVTPSTDAYSGSLSARMEKVPDNFAAPGIQAHDGNGNAFPVSQNYKFLTGYYKFFPLENDSIRISATLVGGEFSETEEFPLRMGTIKIGEPAEEWTRFEVPITERTPGDIDRGSIAFQLENTSGVHDGSYFLVDSLEFLMDMDPGENSKIGVIKEFVNRRPAFNKFKGNITGDYDGDGISEIAVMQGCTLKIYNPVTQTFDTDYSTDTNDLFMCNDGELAEGVELNLIGFINFGDTKHALVTVDLDGNQLIAVLVGVVGNNETLTVGADQARVVAVLQKPNGRHVILTYLEQDNIFRIIGEKTGGIPGNKTVKKQLFFNTQSEYKLSVKFQGEPGMQLAYDPDFIDPPGDSDLDGDGYPDIPMLKVENNQPSGMAVYGGEDFNLLWEFTFPDEHKENILKRFHGFADVDGNGIKETVTGDNLVITLDGTVHTIAGNFITLDVNDIDDDGFEDIIGINTVDSSIAVYGLMSATSVSDDYEAQIHFRLFQNYPNPFNPSTTISFSINKPENVNLIIFNTLGQAVRTLISETKSAGEYSLKWDGRNDSGQSVSSGPYFYRLKVGESVQTKRMLLLK